MTKLSRARVIKRIQWNADICSLKLDMSPDNFIPGQTIQVGLPDTPRAKMGTFFLVNTPDATFAEICIQRLPDTPLSNQLFYLQPGDALRCTAVPSGHFTLIHVPVAEYLWLFAIDSGVAPFLAILRSLDAWESFEKVILIHEVSIADSSLYLDVLLSIRHHHGEQFEFHQIHKDSKCEQVFGESLAHIIASGELEEALDINLTPDFCQIMVCVPGNRLPAILHSLEIHHNYPHTIIRPGNIFTATIDPDGELFCLPS